VFGNACQRFEEAVAAFERSEKSKWREAQAAIDIG
jgi:hypothetical protein